MKITFELWHLITIVLSVIGAFAGLGKLLLMQFDRRMDERFSKLEKESEKLAKESGEWRRFERMYLVDKAELAEKYVRREDYIRGQSVIEAKLDALFGKVELVQIQGARNGN
ncbi:hypothetical protein ACTJI2_13660 [Pseudoxanthomonas sp. 22568]|uniref:hypothetical protein n=1 Tax=Pseudoxanthomonas sp. 22568 TaxID=3453945 RepID=UPI003F833A7C